MTIAEKFKFKKKTDVSQTSIVLFAINHNIDRRAMVTPRIEMCCNSMVQKRMIVVFFWGGNAPLVSTVNIYRRTSLVWYVLWPKTDKSLNIGTMNVIVKSSSQHPTRLLKTYARDCFAYENFQRIYGVGELLFVGPPKELV